MLDDYSLFLEYMSVNPLKDGRTTLFVEVLLIRDLNNIVLYIFGGYLDLPSRSLVAFRMYFIVVPGIEPRALSMLSTCSVTEPRP